MKLEKLRKREKEILALGPYQNWQELYDIRKEIGYLSVKQGGRVINCESFNVGPKMK